MEELLRTGEGMEKLVDNVNHWEAMVSAICYGIDYTCKKFGMDPIEMAEKISEMVKCVNTELGRL